jgi:hypothetical protein
VRARASLADDEGVVAARLADPVTWGELYLRNRDGSPRSYWPHQVEDLRAPDRQIVHLDGRDSGKRLKFDLAVIGPTEQADGAAWGFAHVKHCGRVFFRGYGASADDPEVTRLVDSLNTGAVIWRLTPSGRTTLPRPTRGVTLSA